jgi:hypothetical protein
MIRRARTGTFHGVEISVANRNQKFGSALNVDERHARNGSKIPFTNLWSAAACSSGIKPRSRGTHVCRVRICWAGTVMTAVCPHEYGASP